MKVSRRISLSRLQTMFMETFGLGRAAALAAALLFILASIFAAFWFFKSAPPDTLTISAGPEGSIFRTNAEKYEKILARNGVKLKILTSEGSLENLKRLADPKFRVDIGFVQGGITDKIDITQLVSLGSISYQPLLVFYRSASPVELLSGFAGKRLAVGQSGSGTRSLTLTLLAANGIEPGGPTQLLDLDADDAAKALIDGSADAVFLMGDAASVKTMRLLLLKPGIRIFNFTQADGYTRRITYLNKLELPKGSIDFGKDIPAHDVELIGPTVELIARQDLHPALSDLLIEAAQEVHGKAGLLKRRGEFPSPVEYEFRISSDASRYYKSGKGFLYRYLPFWVASLVSRALAVIVPLVVVLLPGLRIIPAVYRWRIKLRIYRWYRALLVLEQSLISPLAPVKREELLARLDRIEEEVNKMKVPASFADQFYVLRGHISFVHNRLVSSTHFHPPGEETGSSR